MKRNTKKPGLTRTRFTRAKLKQVILAFLDEREADMTADYQPEDEIWKKYLADAMADYILSKL